LRTTVIDSLRHCGFHAQCEGAWIIPVLISISENRKKALGKFLPQCN